MFGTKETFEEEIAQLSTTLKGLEAEDRETIHAQMIENEEPLNNAISAFQQEIREYQFLLANCCLNIMRRWHLPAERVTKNFSLKKLLEQHIREDTSPVNPHPIERDYFDWEKSYYLD